MNQHERTQIVIQGLDRMAYTEKLIKFAESLGALEGGSTITANCKFIINKLLDYIAYIQEKPIEDVRKDFFKNFVSLYSAKEELEKLNKMLIEEGFLK